LFLYFVRVRYLIMEMYTNDLVDLVAKYAEKEKEYRNKHGDYAVNELLHDLQIETRKILHTRLGECFETLFDVDSKDLEPLDVNDLHKVINEL